MLGDMMRAWGLQARTAGSAAEAVAVLENSYDEKPSYAVTLLR